MQIKHLKHNEIDFDRWNNVILNAHNQLIYAHSWFLDIVTPNWEALVTKNYEYVMPLPTKRKYGVSYLVQPPHTQQLGVFSSLPITQEIVQKFITNIPSLSYEINLNEKNVYSIALEQPNYVLNLNTTYENLNKKYSKNTQRNLIKAKQLGIHVNMNIDIDEFWEFNSSVTKQYSTAHQNIVKQLIEKGVGEKAMNLHGVFSTENKLIAALCVLISEHRITYLLPISSAEGKSASAMFLLIDELVKSNEKKDILLDFEGSRIEGIARFYKGFGAKNQPYYTLKRNRPSFLIGKLNTK